MQCRETQNATENRKTHFLQTDFRINSLYQIITGLDNSINVLEKKLKDIHWFDGYFFREETEPIYGLAFIAFQNYINSSIKDFSGNTADKIKYYKIGLVLGLFEKTSIELIIGLANYSKHKDDDGNLHLGTREILESFRLNSEKEAGIEESPIFEGLDILSETWDLFKIMEIVTNWRETLWSSKN